MDKIALDLLLLHAVDSSKAQHEKSKRFSTLFEKKGIASVCNNAKNKSTSFKCCKNANDADNDHDPAKIIECNLHAVEVSITLVCCVLMWLKFVRVQCVH